MEPRHAQRSVKILILRLPKIRRDTMRSLGTTLWVTNWHTPTIDIYLIRVSYTKYLPGCGPTALGPAARTLAPIALGNHLRVYARSCTGLVCLGCPPGT